MSLQHAAQHLAAQGRGPDNTLVHMSNDEVAGLQAIAKMKGGSLTINPETGMAEAGFLSDIMPTLVGAAGMYFGVDPMTTAAIMGGGTAVTTGDLGKGLMAGLGAYGGGSMVQGLSGLGSAGSGFANQTMGENLAGGWEMAKANPSAAMSAMGGKNIAMAAAPAIVGAMQPDAVTPQGHDQMIRPYTFAANAQTPQNMVGASYQPGQDTSERMWFQPQYTAQTPYKAAGGGLMALAGGGSASLGGYSDGGRMLKGPGDGMSDSIPAMIGSKQPARLADGEFVVPADVVSHLGNGSTDAGAKQLYKMMDRIRAQRTGKKKQAPEVNPAKAMPA